MVFFYYPVAARFIKRITVMCRRIHGAAEDALIVAFLIVRIVAVNVRRMINRVKVMRTLRRCLRTWNMRINAIRQINRSTKVQAILRIIRIVLIIVVARRRIVRVLPIVVVKCLRTHNALRFVISGKTMECIP